MRSSSRSPSSSATTTPRNGALCSGEVTRTIALAAGLALAAIACCGGHRATSRPSDPVPSDARAASADASVTRQPAWQCEGAECTLAELERGCAERVLLACNLLGVAYARGQIVEQDLARAVQLWDDACVSGHGRACFNLAGARGLDHPDAWLEAMTHGCELSDSLPCQSIAEAYAHGQLGSVDHVRSAEFYQRACDLDRADACHALADAYRAGRGVHPDPARADALVTRACTLRPKHTQCTRRP